MATSATKGDAVCWVRPEPVPFDRNGPVTHAYVRPPPDFTQHAILDLLTAAVDVAGPTSVALVGTAERLGYAELLERVGRIAAHIAEYVPRAAAVAALLPNTPTGFAGLLACMVAGRVCIVLDAAQPRSRTAAILEDAKPAAILLLDAAAAGTDLPTGARPLHIADALAAPPGSAPCHAFNPDEPALVHYTSGSSGRPKGVVISSRAALRRALVYLDAWHIDASDSFLGTMQPSSNAGFCSNLAVLCAGGRVLTHSLATEGIASLQELIRREGLTLLGAVPSVARLLFTANGARETFSKLRVLNSIGESLVQSDIAAWRKLLPADCNILHGYASTEAMFGAVWFIPPSYTSAEARLPAGYPLADQDYALLDESGRAVANGEPGELALRSPHIACGEWQDGRCVAGRIQPDSSRPGWRILRTGDLMRLGADGMLRFVSRTDRQIKINGVRIEPAEIEAVLRRGPGVRDAVVVAKPGTEAAQLIAYVAADKPRHATLRPLLHASVDAALPSAMRSLRIVMLDQLPYLPIGKVDLNALPKPHAQRRARTPPVVTAGTQRLLTVIAETLKVPVQSLAETSTMRNTPHWDSLHHVLLMMRVETHYGVALTDQEMAAATSVKAIRGMLKSRHRG